MHEEALEDVGVTPQMHAAQSPGLVEVGVGAFEAIAAPAEQAQPTGTTYPAPVGIHGPTGRSLPAPPASPAIRLRCVAAQPQFRQYDQRRIAVVTLVADHLGGATAGRQHRFDLFGRGNQRLDHGLRLASCGVGAALFRRMLSH